MYEKKYIDKSNASCIIKLQTINAMHNLLQKEGDIVSENTNKIKEDKEQDDTYACLKLENQLCFPLYACSKEVIRKYKPLLDKLDLTYTQYIAMMVLWEKKTTNVKELGEMLFLDSGTLTPLLKKLEQKEYITRHRKESDERNLLVSVTKKGMKLREKAVSIPEQMGSCICLPPEDAKTLYDLLHKILRATSGDQDAKE